MNSHFLNIVIGVVGLVLMLAGLVFLRTEVVAIPLTGIGGSILATAVVNWILTRRFESIPINSIVEALAQKTQFMRTQHEVELIFTIKNDKLHLEKRHKYNLHNPSRFRRSRTISMFTDAPTSNPNSFAGFQLVVEPDGTQLEGDLISTHISHQDGKYVFSKTYDLQPGDGNSFEFRSHDTYRLTDRLIWTVQDISDNFTVRIINHTRFDNPFTVKINHHREKEIVEQMKRLDSASEIMFQFNCEILPYQGFEIMWAMDGTKDNKIIEQMPKVEAF